MKPSKVSDLIKKFEGKDEKPIATVDTNKPDFKQIMKFWQTQQKDDPKVSKPSNEVIKESVKDDVKKVSKESIKDDKESDIESEPLPKKDKLKKKKKKNKNIVKE